MTAKEIREIRMMICQSELMIDALIYVELYN